MREPKRPCDGGASRDADRTADDELSTSGKVALFVVTTLLGSFSWVMTKVLVEEIEGHLADGESTSGLILVVAVFTAWATSLGASLSVVASDIPAALSPGDDETAYTLGQLLLDSLPFVVLFDLYCVFQGASLLFLSVNVVTTDSYAAMMLATAALSRVALGTRLGANELAGLGFIALALAIVGAALEAVGGDDDSAAPAAGGGASGASLGVACACAAGACYATTNVAMQGLLAARGRALSPLALTAAYSLLAFASTTLLVYPGLFALGALSSAAAWWRVVRVAPATFGVFVLSKLAWYNLEAVLVQRLGAVWAAVSGVALVAPAWAAELVAAYGYDAAWGARWAAPSSDLQLASFVALALGVAVQSGVAPLFDADGACLGFRRAPAADEQTPFAPPSPAPAPAAAAIPPAGDTCLVIEAQAPPPR